MRPILTLAALLIALPLTAQSEPTISWESCKSGLDELENEARQQVAQLTEQFQNELTASESDCAARLKAQEAAHQVDLSAVRQAYEEARGVVRRRWLLATAIATLTGYILGRL